jgi:hypothetical protein
VNSVWQDTLAFEDPKTPFILGWFHTDFFPCNLGFQFLAFNTTLQTKISRKG